MVKHKHASVLSLFSLVFQDSGSADVNIQLWKLAQARLALTSKSSSDALDRGAIQIGDLPATAFTHDDMEDQVKTLVKDISGLLPNTISFSHQIFFLSENNSAKRDTCFRIFGPLVSFLEADSSKVAMIGCWSWTG